MLLDCRGFKQDCPDGQLSKDKILEMYSMILPAGNAKVFVDQIFRIFDKDGNGSIDFKVICNVSCTVHSLSSQTDCSSLGRFPYQKNVNVSTFLCFFFANIEITMTK